MRSTGVALAWLLTTAVAGADQAVTAEQWASPRHGESLVALVPLRGIMQELSGDPQARLVIRRPDGETGLLWAEELQSWLVALGLSSARIEIVPDSPS
jgi:hypothetical protein